MDDLPIRVRSTALMPIDGHWRSKGDLVARPDLAFPFSVEVKDVEGWDFFGLWHDKWPVAKWWRQCCDQAKTTRACPLLIFTRNRRPDYVAFPFALSAIVGALRRIRSLDYWPADGEPTEGFRVGLLSDLLAVPWQEAIKAGGREWA
jgi:hypothetical protein